MAISVGNVSTEGGVNVGSPHSWSHTVGAGSDRVIVALISLNSHSDVSGVTFDGVAMTELARVQDDGGGSLDAVAEVWYLVAPNEVTGSVEVTYSAGDDIVATAIDFTGVDQMTPFSTNVTDSGDVNSATISNGIASASDELVVDCLTIRSERSVTVGADQTQRSNHAAGQSSTAFPQNATSTEPGSATTTMSWDESGGFTRYAHILGSLQPAAAGGGGLSIPVAMHHYRQQRD